MSAADNLHPVQLAMFGLGSDVKKMVTTSGDLNYKWTSSTEYSSKESMDELWDRKEAESRKPRDTGHGSGVYDSLKEKGYVGQNNGDAVMISHGDSDSFLWDGHHRVAAAAALESEGQPTWVPLRHMDPRQQARQDAHFGSRRVHRPNPALDAAIADIGKHFL